MLEFNATFFIAMISFIIFMIIMNAILYKPLGRIVNERKDLIDKNLEKSRVTNEKIDTLTKWQKSSIEKAQKSSRELYQKVIKEYKDKKESILEYEKNLTRKEIARASAVIEGEANITKSELKSEVKNLASIIASKVLGYETQV